MNADDFTPHENTSMVRHWNATKVLLGMGEHEWVIGNRSFARQMWFDAMGRLDEFYDALGYRMIPWEDR